MAGGKKYLAASIPRSVRTARLGHLPLDKIIGCHFIEQSEGANLTFDVIMLPEAEFIRARSYLTVPNMAGMGLDRAKFAPPYIPKDVKEVVVPDDHPDPVNFAKNYFIKAFGLTHIR